MTRVVDAAIGAAWAMEERALVTLLEIASREQQITPEALAAYSAEALKDAERATFRNGVAVIDAEGPLFKHANLMTAYCGATSYDVVRRDLQTALDDGNVRAVMVNIDSPGGEVAGCAELAQAIFEARGKKPIVAYVGDQACSAAYWIASACDEIVIGVSGAVGSIGVRCTVPDTSARDARSGVVRHEFVSSQSPYKASDPSTDDGRARLQSRVDALAQIFVETVARNRGVSAAQVLDGFGKGDVFIGQAAIDAGMADSFGTFESTLAKLAATNDPFNPNGLMIAALRGPGKEEKAAMPSIEEMNAAVEAAKTQTTASVTAALGATHEAAIITAKAQATATAQAAERERVSGIYAASFAGYETARDEAIQSGSSVADFKAIIVEKEHAKAREAAAAIGADVGQNAGVRVVPTKPEPVAKSAGEKAAETILSAFALFK